MYKKNQEGSVEQHFTEFVDLDWEGRAPEDRDLRVEAAMEMGVAEIGVSTMQHTRRPSVLLSKRCPHTGVVNYFDAAEPHLAIGSIIKCGAAAADFGYTWRFYGLERSRGGHAPDAPSAERNLRAQMCESYVWH